MPEQISQAATASAAPGVDTLFEIGPGVEQAVQGRPYERASDDPVYRPLRIYALDPAVSRLEGAVALVNIPYEPLQPGPVGRVFEVDNEDGNRRPYRRVHLDDPRVLIRNGRDPSIADPQFHQQMVYAVSSIVYATFRKALGRHLAWFNDDPHHPRARLKLRPHACSEERNAFYDRDKGEICFGYFRAAPHASGRNLPGGWVFTCLAHDIIAHEVTHALLDGLRARFAVASNADVPAFHEAFADLVAIFQHFSYEQILRDAIRRSRGRLEESKPLTNLASQFGHTTRGQNEPLRDAVVAETQEYDEASHEPHERGAILVAAAFEAFITVFRRKTERYVQLATNGSGVLGDGELPAGLQMMLAKEAGQLAEQFLNMCIRAIDYCPPVDIEFGEFLRAVITADQALVPDDPWGYREAWIDAFRRRGIYPRNTRSLAEDALVWQQPQQTLKIEELSFARLNFEGDPGRPASQCELRRQACALGTFITHPEHRARFGLVSQNDRRLGGDRVSLPRIESIRSSRRIGPDGQVIFDLVAEVTQCRYVAATIDNEEFEYYGGATIIIDPHGRVRYVIYKHVLGGSRLERQRSFLAASGNDYWQLTDGRRVPRTDLFKRLHGSAG